MADGNKSGIEKLRDYAYGMNSMRCDDVFEIAINLEREHTDALNAKIETICTLTREIDQLRDSRLTDDARKVVERLRATVKQHGSYGARIASALGVAGKSTCELGEEGYTLVVDRLIELIEHCGKQYSDREAAADWVSAHGGLDAVEVGWVKKQEVGWTLLRVVDALGLEIDKRTNDDIMDELDERLMPPGLSWPQWDDGKPITEDDAPEDVMAVSIGLDGSCYALHYDIPDYDQMMFAESSKYVERHAPEVLGADGLPIKVGDTVFSDDRTAWIINGLNDGEYLSVEKVLDASRSKMRPEYFTHKPYDAQKRIDDDATLAADVYCKNYGIEVNSNGGFDLASFIVPMITDLLRRQRELDSKMGGE